MSIEYLIGDATEPIKAGSHRRMIIHCCNDVGGWGRGFVLALSKKWKYVEQSYREWYKNKIDFDLGEIQIIPIKKSDISVCNMIGQRGLKSKNGIPPIRYDAIRECIVKIVKNINIPKIGNVWSIHAPRFGAGLAEGDWGIIENILVEEVPENIPVYIYDLPDPKEQEPTKTVIKQVLVVRKDLKNIQGHKIRTGKLISQGAHASMKVFFDRGHFIHNISQGNYSLEIPLTDEMKDWCENLFTKITLGVKSKEELLDIYQDAVDAGLPVAYITDSGLTEFSEPTDTALAIGPANASDIDKITGHLNLF